MKRRDFIAGTAAALAYPFTAWAQQPPQRIVGFINGGSADAGARLANAFRQGLDETGLREGQNLTVEYHWLNGRNDLLPALVADLVRRQVTVIATPGSVPATLAAKSATSSIPIVFGIPRDPVQLGLVVSLARPQSNATGVNFFLQEVTAKRLRLLHDLLPKALRIAVLVNPANASIAESTSREVQDAARTIGLQTRILQAATGGEIDTAFDAFNRERPDALFVAPDGFYTSRRNQFVALAARSGIPAVYAQSDFVTAGGLMSYGTSAADMFHQVGLYTGRIVNGAKPADLPVVQSTKFELALNLKTAKALDIEVPPEILSIADEVIE